MSAGVIAGGNENCAAASPLGCAALNSPVPGEWNAERFGREQIRAMVRRIFLQESGPPVRQVIFSAASGEIKIDDLCQRVAHTLAEEQPQEVALLCVGEGSPAEGCCIALKQAATPLGKNLWFLQDCQCAGKRGPVYSYLAAARAQFEYSIVVGLPAEDPNALLPAAKFCDGVVLVLSALHTRRVAALHIKRALDEAGVRILGTVLMDREFPIPESLYRHL